MLKTLAQAGRLRLHSQRIAGTPFKSPAEVVGWLGAMQAQDYAGVKWSIGLRMESSSEAAVEQALAAGSIIRTWPMRGTLHVAGAQDVRWLLGLVAARNIAGSAGRHRQLELDEATFTRSQHLLDKALRDGAHKTRAELYALLQAEGISTAGQRGIHILWRAAQTGLICFGPLRAKQPTFTLLEEWAPQARPLERDLALAELARRYFTSRGPATVQDFAWWTGITLAEARAGLESAKSTLVQETMDGQEYWLAPYGSAPRASAEVHLLPGFDEFVLGYKERGMVLDAQYAERICPGGNGVFYPTLIIGGRVAGLWKRSVKKQRVVVSAEPFGRALSSAESGRFAKAAKRYGRYLGMQVE